MPNRSFSLDSGSFSYQIKIANDLIEISNPLDKPLLSEIANIIKKTKSDLTKIGFKPLNISIFSSSNAGDFAKKTGQPWFISAFTIDNTIYSQRFSALKDKNMLNFTLRHEIFHTVQPKNWPKWLSEGLARRFSGEFINDSKQKTGFETLTDMNLDKKFINYTNQQELNRAYHEATRRASRLLNQFGWKGLIPRL